MELVCPQCGNHGENVCRGFTEIERCINMDRDIWIVNKKLHLLIGIERYTITIFSYSESPNEFCV